MSMSQLLVLNIPPELEDELVDYLLGIEALSGFTSYPVRGHGEQRRLSIAEQVTGRRKRVQFELILSAPALTTLLEGLSSVGTDIYYWYQDVAGSGHC
ncbi:DUF3240 family protein [Spongiibacter sp. KMU-158]|uniref:DUF3240 family protein n=1 Tax=Spongiibacter pelagi TaxID=2760804 RepID=A0A927C382_9GAMM|nr:DUF3240 family protein [Spongiibacter pelagi]MBD2858655.1 DUF3240 family protein [Spongiibacter pelagi]